MSDHSRPGRPPNIMTLEYLISLLTRTKMCVSSISNPSLIEELEAVIKQLKNNG